MSAEATSLSIPTRRRRFLCMIYEGILLFGVCVGVLLPFDILTQSQHALWLRDYRQAILFMAIGLYFLLSWRRNGQTLPMKTWRMRLQMPTGAKLSWWRALYRYGLMWVLPLIFALGVQFLAASLQNPDTLWLIVLAPFAIFIWTWFDPNALFLHDRLAGTRIIDLRPHIKN